MTTEISSLQQQVFKQLADDGIAIQSQDFTRPWGGFMVIDKDHLAQFVRAFFPELLQFMANNENWSPKILFVAPYKKLSWQYHHRRSEVWRVIMGKVGIARSQTNQIGEQEILLEGDKVELEQGERHRLIGLDQWGVVAEIWQHTDPNKPSDENDIIRLEDDFGRT